MIYSAYLESDRMIPMRDGVRLAMDLYWPADGDGRRIDQSWPVILVRTSYNKTFSEWDGVPDWYAQRGYISRFRIFALATSRKETVYTTTPATRGKAMMAMIPSSGSPPSPGLMVKSA